MLVGTPTQPRLLPQAKDGEAKTAQMKTISIETNRRTTLSHIVTIEALVKDAAAVRAACQRLALPEPVQGKTELFSGEVEGLAVKLPGWRLPGSCRPGYRPDQVRQLQGQMGRTRAPRPFSSSVCRREGEDRKQAQGASGLGKHSCRWLRKTHRSGQRRCRLKTIEIIVTPKGETTVTTKGFVGSSCRDASKFLESALGQRVGEQLYRRVPSGRDR